MHNSSAGEAGPQLDRIDPRHIANTRAQATRELAEVILKGSRWLAPPDRALISAVYDHGLSATEVARVRGEQPRSVRRRVRKLAEHISSPAFTFVLLHKETWTPTRRRVAEQCILSGKSMRTAAKHLGTSLHNVRKEMNAINALIDLYTIEPINTQQRADHDNPTSTTQRKREPETSSATRTSNRPNSAAPHRKPFRYAADPARDATSSGATP